MSNIILFDGMCHLCSNSVQFIIKRDPKGIFSFASLQSDIGQQLLHTYHINKQTDSLVFIHHGRAYIKSTAALKICKDLRSLWKIAYIFILIPKPIRDGIYTFIARNRYKWFGKKTVCMLPNPELRKRFLE